MCDEFTSKSHVRGYRARHEAASPSTAEAHHRSGTCAEMLYFLSESYFKSKIVLGIEALVGITVLVFGIV